MISTFFSTDSIFTAASAIRHIAERDGRFSTKTSTLCCYPLLLMQFTCSTTYYYSVMTWSCVVDSTQTAILKYVHHINNNIKSIFFK